MEIVLSVVIPVYNADKYISRCLDSIFNQHLEESVFEVVIVNDGSVDDSLDVIYAYKKIHKNIVVINQENAGVSIARNKGIDNSSGDYILFVDADDVLIENTLLKILEILLEDRLIDFLVTNQLRISENKQDIVHKEKPCIKSGVVYTGIDAFHQGYIRNNAGGAICSRAFLNRFDLRFPVGIKNGEDTILFSLAQYYAQNLVYVDIDLYGIMLGEQSASRGNSSYCLNLLETIGYYNNIRRNISGTSVDNSIIEYNLYQFISNLTYYSIVSNRLSLNALRNKLYELNVFPLSVSGFSKKKNSAMLMNYSYRLFYLMSFIKHLINK